MDTEEDDGGGRWRVAAARSRADHGAAAAEETAAARPPPPAIVRERGVPAAVGDRVPRRPRQALLLLPPLRIPAVNTK